MAHSWSRGFPSSTGAGGVDLRLPHRRSSRGGGRGASCARRCGASCRKTVRERRRKIGFSPRPEFRWFRSSARRSVADAVRLLQSRPIGSGRGRRRFRVACVGGSESRSSSGAPSTSSSACGCTSRRGPRLRVGPRRSAVSFTAQGDGAGGLGAERLVAPPTPTPAPDHPQLRPALARSLSGRAGAQPTTWAAAWTVAWRRRGLGIAWSPDVVAMTRGGPITQGTPPSPWTRSGSPPRPAALPLRQPVRSASAWQAATMQLALRRRGHRASFAAACAPSPALRRPGVSTGPDPGVAITADRLHPPPTTPTHKAPSGPGRVAAAR